MNVTDTIFQCMHSLADAYLHVGQCAEAHELAEMIAETQLTLAKVHGKIASEMVIGMLMSIEDERLPHTSVSAPEVARALNLGNGRLS